jgi:hypothetical protein
LCSGALILGLLFRGGVLFNAAAFQPGGGTADEAGFPYFDSVIGSGGARDGVRDDQTREDTTAVGFCGGSVRDGSGGAGQAA